MAIFDRIGNSVLHIARGRVPFSAYGGVAGYDGYGYSMAARPRALPGSKIDYNAIAGPLWMNPTAAACLAAITDAFAQADPFLEELKGDKWSRIEHPLTDLLHRPNPDYSAKQLWGATIVSEKSQGAGFWRLVWNKSGSQPVQIYFEPPRLPTLMLASSSIAPTWDETEFISGYVLWVDGKPYAMDKHEVVYFRSSLNIENTRLPWSPLATGVREVSTLNGASTYEAGLLRNGAVPAQIISIKEGQRIDPDKLLAFKQQLNQQLQGDGAGGVAIASLPVDVHKACYSPQDLALDTLKSWPQATVCALLRTPAMVALLPAGDEQKTYANLAAAHRWWWDNCIIPLEDGHGEEIATQMFPMFDLDPKFHRISWDRSKVPALQDDQKELFDRIGNAYVNQIIDRDEARVKLGYASDAQYQGVFYQGSIQTPQNDRGSTADEVAPLRTVR